MKFTLYQKRIGNLSIQRNALLGLNCGLFTITLLLIVLLFFKNEKTIISPPELKQSYWVEGNRFSPSYLEEMALYFTHLLLDVTESNIMPQGEILLRYISPDSYGHFKAKIIQDEKKLKKEQLSLHFLAQDIHVFPSTLTAEVGGDLISYVGSQRVSSVRETYRIVFKQKLGRLFLESFQIVKSEKEQGDERDA